ncbi:MAG: carboxypeptidase regulatory-like domain-containing protein [Kofleriaceae bacterium]
MRRRRVLVIGLLIAGAALALDLWIHRESAPRYEGRRYTRDGVVTFDLAKPARQERVESTLRGEVRTRSGAPVADALVVTAYGFRTRTDTRGHFEMAASSGRQFVDVVSPAGQPVDDSMFTLPEHGVLDVVIVVDGGCSIRGQIVDARGTPVPDIEVAMGNHQATSDGDGRFGFDGLLPGTAMLDLPLLTSTRVPCATKGSDCSVLVELTRSVPATPTFVLPALGTISGRVIDERDRPVDHAELEATRNDPPNVFLVRRFKATARTERDGSFQIPVFDGTYDLRVASPDGSETTSLRVMVGTTMTIRLGTAGTIAGSIHRADRSPVHEFDVELDGTGFERTQHVMSPGGRFTIARVPAGKHHLTIVADRGYRELDVVMPGGTTETLDVEVAPTVTVVGRNVGLGGQPIVNARLAIKGRQLRGSPKTDDDGSFELVGLWLGAIELLVSPGREDPRKRHVFLEIHDDPSGKLDLGDVEIDVDDD